MSDWGSDVCSSDLDYDKRLSAERLRGHLALCPAQSPEGCCPDRTGSAVHYQHGPLTESKKNWPRAVHASPALPDAAMKPDKAPYVPRPTLPVARRNDPQSSTPRPHKSLVLPERALPTNRFERDIRCRFGCGSPCRHWARMPGRSGDRGVGKGCVGT